MMKTAIFGFGALFTITAACSGGAGGSGSNDAAAGGSSVGGTGGTAGTAGAGGSAGSSGASGSAGAAGSTGGSAGKPAMCSSSAECKEAEVSYPENPSDPSPQLTECVGGQCGLVTSYYGSYESPKSPRSCTEICAASSYEGSPMACSPSCSVEVVNGFGDKTLSFVSENDAGPGAVAGLARYQFSPISGAFKFVEVGCSEVPTKKLIQGSNSYTYVHHSCCCVAP